MADLGLESLTIITKHPILGVAAALDPPSGDPRRIRGGSDLHLEIITKTSEVIKALRVKCAFVTVIAKRIVMVHNKRRFLVRR